MEEDCSTDGSIVELQVPPKSSPPCILLEEDDVIPNSPWKDENRPNPFYEAICRVREKEPGEGSGGERTTPNHWTLDMIEFYDDDWGEEESFLVHKIQQDMDKNPNLWKVSDKDILNRFSGRDRKKRRVKCHNCCQFGHVAASCPDPPKVLMCYMCGGPGHEPRRCPHSKCLNCGASSRNFIDMCNKCIKESEKTCSRCKLQGHYFINCSDHWRKFHVTTGSDIRIPTRSNVHKTGSKQWCSNCGSKGHFEIECRLKRNRCFSQTSPYIASYEDLFSSTHNPEPVPGSEKKRMKFAERKRYFQETKKDKSTPESSRNPSTGRDDEITVLFEGLENTENRNHLKNKKSRIDDRRTNAKNKGKKSRRRKEKGKNIKRGSVAKWKEMFNKHQKRKEVPNYYNFLLL